VSNLHADNPASEDEIEAAKRRIIYRHLAWIYTLRSQLLIPTPWEHVKQRGMVGIYAKQRIKKYGLGLYEEEFTKYEFADFLPKEDRERLINAKNTAAQIIDKQSDDLKMLRKQGLIDDFRHMELQKLLNEFYDHQGKLERIKKFPLPRQYGSISFILVGIFITVLPFGMLPLFAPMGPIGLMLSIPFTALVAWVYLVMELVGDYSENPFEGTANDIPMYSLCRTIEIDLKEMLGEKDLPPSIEAKNGVLM
jgi:putative membrane protein